MITRDDFIRAIEAPIVIPIFKFALLNSDQTVKYCFIQDVIDDQGQIQVNLQDGARRSCTIELINKNAKWVPSYKTGFWSYTKFQIWLGVKINGVDYFPPDSSQGVFILKNVQITSDPNKGQVAQIEGTDKFSLLNGDVSGVLDKVYCTDKGITITKAIQDLLNYAKDTVQPIISHNFYNMVLPGLLS